MGLVIVVNVIMRETENIQSPDFSLKIGEITF